MAKIIIDGKEHEVKDGKNLLETCLTLGYDLPYFCWHPALGSVGACRQCAVKKFKDEDDEKGKLTMACMEPIADNLRISISDPEAVGFRKNIIGWLMTNHPHDCPVCDEGGECHLQDMTVMTGHNYRDFRFNKRTHQNQYLGPLINHEMNRCIQCYRCVRFYKDYAGGTDLDVFAAHDHVYFGRAKDGILENEFSGNLVEVCPTGVFTDKTLKQHYTRKWDLTTAPSICVHCSLGCNTIVSERYGSVRRVLSRYNGEVNGYFLCDRGRFGYEFINDQNRIKIPLLRGKDSKKIKVTSGTGIQKAAEFISNSKKVVGIGSPRASLEANFALKKLLKEGNFYAGIDQLQHGMIKRIQEIMTDNPVKTPGLKEISECDAVVILGEDLTNTAPMMALAVRQAVRQQPMEKATAVKIPLWQDAAVRELIQEEKGPLFIATPFATKLEEVSTKSHHATPKELAWLGFAVANMLDGGSEKAMLPQALHSLAKEIAEALKNAKQPLIISGTSCMEPLLVEAAANLAQASYKLNPETKLSYVVPECNSMGLAMMADKAMGALLEDKAEIDTLIVLENDLYIRKDRDSINRILEKAHNVIVLDYLQNDTTQKADLLIPVGTFAESEGTYISQEGRAQRFYQVYPPGGDIMESWRWLNLMAEETNNIQHSSVSYDTLVNDLVSSHPQFDGLQHLAPLSDFRIARQKIAREPHRYSGRTAMHADSNVSEAKPPEDKHSPLSFTMEGYHGKPPSPLIPFFWSPGWNSAQSINKYQIEVGGPLHGGDPGVRLLQPKSNAEVRYFKYTQDREAGEKGEMIIVPRHHIFGSEELSSKSLAIAELSPEPYIGISEKDAEKLQVKDGEPVAARWGDVSHREKASVIKGLPIGVVAIPQGINGFFDFVKQPRVTLTKPEQ